MKKVCSFVLILICIFWLQKSKTRIKNNEIVVGTTSTYYPFTFIENGEYKGFDIELMQQVINEMKKTMKIKDMPFDALVPHAQIGKIHIIAAGLSPLPERKKRLFFSDSYYYGNPLALITLATESPLRNLDDLKNKKVVVNQGFPADMLLSKLDGINIIRLEHISEALLALHMKKVDLFVSEVKPIQLLMEQYEKDHFTVNYIANTDAQYGFAISKKYPELVPKINKALKKLKENNTIANLKKKWKL